MVIVEETIKLLPLMVLIATRKSRTAHGAMLCGSFCGLTFGMVEGISFGYLEYPAQQSPITTYLTRFLVMGPQHAVWDSLAGGIIFLIGTQRADDRQQRGRRPTAW